MRCFTRCAFRASLPRPSRVLTRAPACAAMSARASAPAAAGTVAAEVINNRHYIQPGKLRMPCTVYVPLHEIGTALSEVARARALPFCVGGTC